MATSVARELELAFASTVDVLNLRVLNRDVLSRGQPLLLLSWSTVVLLK